MTPLQFYTLTLNNLPSIGAFIAGLVLLYRQGRMKATIQANHAEAQAAVEDVKASVNGVQNKLLSATASASHAQGMSDQRDADSAIK